MVKIVNSELYTKEARQSRAKAQAEEQKPDPTVAEAAKILAENELAAGGGTFVPTPGYLQDSKLVNGIDIRGAAGHD